MAGKPKITAKIIDMAPVGDRMRVSVEFNDGQGEPWYRPFDIKYERPISLEEFAVMLGERDISRPDDPYMFIKEAKKSGETFVVTPKEQP